MSTKYYGPRNAGEVASQTDSILLRRWASLWVDSLVTVTLLVLPDVLLGNDTYQATLAIWLALPLLYFVVCEWRWGQTLGKFVTRLVIVTADGTALSLCQALIRTAFRVIETNPVVFGGIPAGIVVASTTHKQRLGDLVAKTYVVSKTGLAAARPHWINDETASGRVDA
jgi:uncharacterized RDD family membrane protein YckC